MTVVTVRVESRFKSLDKFATKKAVRVSKKTVADATLEEHGMDGWYFLDDIL